MCTMHKFIKGFSTNIYFDDMLDFIFTHLFFQLNLHMYNLQVIKPPGKPLSATASDAIVHEGRKPKR